MSHARAQIEMKRWQSVVVQGCFWVYSTEALYANTSKFQAEAFGQQRDANKFSTRQRIA
ncbi:hypothetical protein E4U46_008208 [Claviceps purpurea]|nr:hypothetical protein E4U46_008208 [Claviceps purpurea]